MKTGVLMGGGGSGVHCQGCGLLMDAIGPSGAVTVLHKRGHTVTVLAGTFEQKCRRCGEVTPVHITNGTAFVGIDKRIMM